MLEGETTMNVSSQQPEPPLLLLIPLFAAVLVKQTLVYVFAGPFIAAAFYVQAIKEAFRDSRDLPLFRRELTFLARGCYKLAATSILIGVFGVAGYFHDFKLEFTKAKSFFFCHQGV